MEDGWSQWVHDQAEFLGLEVEFMVDRNATHQIEQHHGNIMQLAVSGEGPHTQHWNVTLSQESGIDTGRFTMGPDALPILAGMQPAIGGWGTPLAPSASLFLVGPPGTFSDFGSGPNAVLSVTSHLGIDHGFKQGVDESMGTFGTIENRNGTWFKMEHLADHPTSERASPAHYGIPVETLIHTDEGSIVLDCDCTRVVLHGGTIGALNRVEGILDEDRELIAMLVTPWIEPNPSRTTSVSALQEAASTYVETEFGSITPDIITLKGISLDLHEGEGHRLVAVMELWFSGDSWRDPSERHWLLLDAETHEVLDSRLMEVTDSTPTFPPLLLVLALVALVRFIPRRE